MATKTPTPTMTAIGSLTMFPAMEVRAFWAILVSLSTREISLPDLAWLKNSSDCEIRWLKKLGAKILQHAKAHPRHAVSVEEGENTARDHRDRNKKADPENALDARVRSPVRRSIASIL